MKPATKIVMALLSLVAIGHVLRLFFGWELIVGGWVAPMWVSFLGVAIPGGLAFLMYREHQ
ncbi:MAG: hypothetical protein IH995_06985 [Proteobacteria bacterium]|nr:hypothetical protein [Pseudomonadota bacterium]